MADKNIEIGIKATGGDAAANQVDKVTNASNRFLTAAEREVAEVERLVRSARALAAAQGNVTTSQKDATRWLDQTAEKARVAEFAYYDLNAELGKTNKASETFTSGQTQIQKSSRNSAQALYVFSQGLEDASYGLRGVLNNIPQLVFALGGTAGIAGAISIGAVALSQIIPLFTETEEKASDVADRISEIAENMGEMEADRIQQVADGIDAARDRAEALKQEFDDTRAAENAFSTAALDNTSKLAEAQRNVAEALGQQVDSYKELQAIAAAEEEKRRLAAEQAIDAEKQKLAAAKQSATEAADYLQAQRQRAAIEQSNLVTLRGQLEALREQKAELERISEKRDSTDDPGRQLLGAIFPKTLPLTDEAKAAREQLADPGRAARLEGIQAKVDALESAVESLTKDGGIVAKAENAFLAAQTQLTDLTTAVGTNIERIQTTLDADNLLARTETVLKNTEQQAKDLSSAVEQIQTSTAAGEAAKQSILGAAADGKITADETQRVAQATSQLIAQIQGGLATAGENTQQVLAILRTIAEQEARNGREIQILKRQVDQLFSRIR